ncbi:hypothetical protein Tco_1344889 [Tanacetum coccineum]
MSTPVFVDPEISTQADGAQSSRVPVPLLEDPYEAIRQAYLDGTNTESEPFEDPMRLRRLKVANMSESTFRKRFRPSYKSSPSSSPPDLPLRKRYREDEGPTAEDEDPVMGDEGLAAGDEGPGMGVERRGLVDKGYSVESDVLGLGEEGRRRTWLWICTRDPERPERVSTSRRPTLTTWTDPEDGMVYIDVPAKPPPAPPVQTTPSLEWSSGSLSISPSPFIVPSPISSPVILLTVPSPVTTLATAKTEGFLTELGAQVEMQGGLIRDPQPFSVERQVLRLQLAEERRARLELVEIIDSMRRGQEPEEMCRIYEEGVGRDHGQKSMGKSWVMQFDTRLNLLLCKLLRGILTYLSDVRFKTLVE